MLYDSMFIKLRPSKNIARPTLIAYKRVPKLFAVGGRIHKILATVRRIHVHVMTEIQKLNEQTSFSTLPNIRFQSTKKNC